MYSDSTTYTCRLGYFALWGLCTKFLLYHLSYWLLFFISSKTVVFIMSFPLSWQKYFLIWQTANADIITNAANGIMANNRRRSPHTPFCEALLSTGWGAPQQVLMISYDMIQVREIPVNRLQFLVNQRTHQPALICHTNISQCSITQPCLSNSQYLSPF